MSKELQISPYVNPSRLMATEQNKTKICEVAKDKWLDAETIAKEIGISYSRVTVLGKILCDEGFMEYEDVMQKCGRVRRTRRHFKTLKPYIENKIQLKEQGKYYRPNNYYGNGKVFNPWEPKIPQGTARTVELFNKKDHDYFRQPLKSKKHGIGSTFSLYDSYALD